MCKGHEGERASGMSSAKANGRREEERDIEGGGCATQDFVVSWLMLVLMLLRLTVTVIISSCMKTFVYM